MDGTSDLLAVLAVLAMFAIVLMPITLFIVLKNRALRRMPLEEFTVVFEVRWTDPKSGLRAQEVNLADDIYLVIGRRGMVAGGGVIGWSGGRRVYLGKVTHTGSGIVEVQGKGRMYEGEMVTERGSVNVGVRTGTAAWYRLTKTPSGALMSAVFEARVLEVRPANQPSRMRSGAVH